MFENIDIESLIWIDTHNDYYEAKVLYVGDTYVEIDSIDNEKFFFSSLKIPFDQILKIGRIT